MLDLFEKYDDPRRVLDDHQAHRLLARSARWCSARVLAVMRVSPVAHPAPRSAPSTSTRAQHAADPDHRLLLTGSALHPADQPGRPEVPDVDVDNNIRWAIVGLAVYHAAFVCEALRSGVNTVPVGQAEAARVDRADLQRRACAR